MFECSPGLLTLKASHGGHGKHASEINTQYFSPYRMIRLGQGLPNSILFTLHIDTIIHSQTQG